MEDNIYQEQLDEIYERRNESIEELKEKIAHINPEAKLADGFDECLIGYFTDGTACYGADLMIGVLMSRDGMSYDDALEYFHYNIEGSYVGEFTPRYMWE